jgi:hypothetical protein
VQPPQRLRGRSNPPTVPHGDDLTASFTREGVAAETATPRGCWSWVTPCRHRRPRFRHSSELEPESVLVGAAPILVSGLTRRTSVAVVLVAISISGVASVALTRRTGVIVICVSLAPARLTRS